MIKNLSSEKNICIHCGLCCDGTLFNWGNISSNEVLDELFQTETIKADGNETIVFSQPCQFLKNCSCSIYNSETPKRPLVCSKFKCKLLNNYEANQISYSESIILIEKTKELALKNDKLIDEAFSKLKELSTSKKIKFLKNKLEVAENQAEFRKKYGNILLNSYAFEHWKKKHFTVNQKI